MGCVTSARCPVSVLKQWLVSRSQNLMKESLHDDTTMLRSLRNRSRVILPWCPFSRTIPLSDTYLDIRKQMRLLTFCCLDLVVSMAIFFTKIQEMWRWTKNILSVNTNAFLILANCSLILTTSQTTISPSWLPDATRMPWSSQASVVTAPLWPENIIVIIIL